MKENRLILILWIAAALLLAVAIIYIRINDQARQVEFFKDHSEIK